MEEGDAVSIIEEFMVILDNVCFDWGLSACRIKLSRTIKCIRRLHILIGGFNILLSRTSPKEIIVALIYIGEFQIDLKDDSDEHIIGEVERRILHYYRLYLSYL